MSYLCGIGYGFGLTPREAHIECDGCGKQRSVTGAGGLPRAWFLNNKAAPGWKLFRPEGKRVDYCPDCAQSIRPAKAKP